MSTVLCLHRSRGHQKRFDLIAQAMDEKLVHDTDKGGMFLFKDELHLASLLTVGRLKARNDIGENLRSRLPRTSRIAINHQPSNCSLSYFTIPKRPIPQRPLSSLQRRYQHYLAPHHLPYQTDPPSYSSPAQPSPTHHPSPTNTT